mgnify:CR=1 FL=1
MVMQRVNQSGVVLIVSLVFLVALTAVAAALMQNTTTDVKMAGASQEKAIVTQGTISEMERVLYNERREVFGSNIFVNLIKPTPILTLTQPLITNATAQPDNPLILDTPCPRSKRASSGLITCRRANVVLNRFYGRNENHFIQINAGIAQEIPTGN